MDLFVERIKEIIQTVKKKLVQDSRKEKLIEYCMIPHIKDKKELEQQIIQHQTADDAQLGQFVSCKYFRDVHTKQSIERPVLTKIKSEYRDKPFKYDDIIQAIGDYFDLFKTNTDRLEALWLQMLNFFGLKPPQECTIFREQHYKNYKKIVICNRTLKLLTDEASKYRSSAEGLDQHLAKIETIIEQGRQLPERYESFMAKVKVKEDLNIKAAEEIRKEKLLLQQKLAKQQQ